jgi:hypothetical protein
MFLLCTVTSGFSQTRQRTTTKKPATASKKTKPTPAKRAENPSPEPILADGATRISGQIKLLTKFIYLLGGVAKTIEQSDEAARKNELSPAGIDQNEKNKSTVKSSIRNIREGLDELEIYFRATPELQRYYLKLAGSAAGAAGAEDLAAAGQFDKSGRALLDVINRLTDVLVAMR